MDSPKLARVLTNGNLDTNFNVNNGFSNQVFTIEVLNDDRILVGGNFTSFNNNISRAAVLLFDNGMISDYNNLNSNFRQGASVSQFLVYDEDNIFVVGNFNRYQEEIKNNIVKISKCELILQNLETVGDYIEYTDNDVDLIRWINCNTEQQYYGVANYSTSFTPENTGRYAAIVYKNNCSNITKCINFLHNDDIINSLSEISSSYSVYPNPANDYITIIGVKGYKILIVDVNGNTVTSEKVYDDSVTLSLKKLNAGVYFLHSFNEEKNFVEKIKVIK